MTVVYGATPFTSLRTQGPSIHLLRLRPEPLHLRLAEIRGRFSGQRREHKRDHVRKPLVPRLLFQQVAAEDHAEGCTVGEVEKTKAGDGDVELHRIDGGAEVAAFDAAPYHGADHLDEW